MLELHQQVFPADRLLGWYGTGSTVDENSFLIQDFFGRTVSSPIHLLIDPTLECGLRVRVYETMHSDSSPEVPASFAHQFSLLPLRYRLGRQDKVAGKSLSPSRSRLPMLTDSSSWSSSVKAALNARAPDLARLSATPGTPQTYGQSVQARLHELLNAVQVAYDYVGAVVEGRITGDPAIGKQLQKAMNSIAAVPLEQLQKLSEAQQKDLTMVSTLAEQVQMQLKLTREVAQVAQLSIAAQAAATPAAAPATAAPQAPLPAQS